MIGRFMVTLTVTGLAFIDQAVEAMHKSIGQ